MLKKENFISIILLTVGTAFIVISILVFFSNGNAKLVKHKLKLGAIIIGLTATAVSCKPTVSCYAPGLPPDYVHFDVDSNFYKDTITVKLPDDSLLTGLINSRTKSQYSYLIQDLLNVEKYSENIIPEDGIFDMSDERFIIKIPSTLDKGTYYLKIYNTEKTNIDTAYFNISRKIKIIK